METFDADEIGFYNAWTGEYADIVFDANGNPYNALTGEQVQLAGQGIKAAENILIGIFGRQGYPQQTRNYPTGRVIPNINREGNLPAGAPGAIGAKGVVVQYWAIGATLVAVLLIALGNVTKRR